MSTDLLKKEQEYRKLNEELESRSKKLMLEVDNMLKIQDGLLKETSTKDVESDPIQITKKNYQSFEAWHSFRSFAKTTLHSNSIQKSVDSKYMEDEALCDDPDSVQQMGIKGMMHYYRTKMKTMLADNDKLHLEVKQKCEELRKVQKEALKTAEEKDKWFQIHSKNKTHISKLENQISALNAKVQAKENENMALKKENDQIKKDLKNVSFNVAANELRLNKTLEENEKMKIKFKEVKQDEKDLQDSHRKETTELRAIVKRLEKQKLELLSAFKKQLQLIENLKRQRDHIEAYKLSEISENEFVKILDWKLEN